MQSSMTHDRAGALGLTVFRSALRREAWFTAMWLGLAGVLGAGSVLAFGPFHETPAVGGLIAGLPAPLVAFLGLGDLDTWAGFLDAVLFGLIAPVAFFSFSIGFGTRAGLICRAAVHGRPRAAVPAEVAETGRRVTLLNLAALVTGCALIGITIFGSVLLAAAAAHIPISPTLLGGAVIAQVGLGVTFGSGGLLLAMLSGRVGLAALITTVAALLADALNGLGPAVPDLRALRYASLVFYAEGGRPVSNGISSTHLAVLLIASVASVAAVALASTGMARRRWAV